METMDIRRMFFKYVSFNVLGMIGLSCYILADTFFVARGVGANGLAALNLAIPIYSFMHGTGLMLGMGGATRFALSKTEKTFTQAVYLGILAACVFLCGGIFFSEQIASLLGADGDTVNLTRVYLQVLLIFSPMFLLNNIVLCFVRNDGDPRLSMIAMLAGSFSNIVLDYIFIFPCNMGMFGAALATGIAPVISLIILSTHFLRKKNTFRFLWARSPVKSFVDITCLGVSSLITEFSSGITIIMFNTIILGLEGNTGVAAYGIIANIALVVISIFVGIAQGMQPVVSHCFSKGETKAVGNILKYGVITAVIVALSVYLLSWIFAEPIVAAFNKDGNVQLAQIAINGLKIYFVAFLFAGVNILCATYFSAMNQGKKAFLISLLRGFIIIVPAAFILSMLFGINGVWAAMTVTESIVLLVSIYFMRQRKRSELI